MLTIAPRRLMRLGRAARVARTVASMLMSNMRCHWASSASRKPAVAWSPPPTLFTSRSMSPSSVRAVSMTAETPSAVLRSAETVRAPDSFSAGVMVRAAPMTRTPSTVRARTVASPMPLLAPVTTAVLLVRLRSLANPGLFGIQGGSGGGSSVTGYCAFWRAWALRRASSSV